MLSRSGLVALATLAACDQVFELERPPDAGQLPPSRADLVDDFEDGMDPRWVRSLDSGDTCEVTTELAVSGTASLRCRTDGMSGSKAALVFDFLPTSTIRVQMSVRFTARPKFFLSFLQAAHASESVTRRLVTSDFYDTSQIDIWNDNTMGIAYVPAPIALRTWYRIDFRARMSSSTGSVEVVVDGMHRAALEDIDTTDLSINQVQIGIALVTTPVEQLTVHIDDVVVSEQ